MKCLWLENKALTWRTDVACPTPKNDETLIRVTLAGVCNTDLELLRGYYPYCGIPGHEFVGVVEDGPRELRGARVVGEINAACRKCDACDATNGRHCPERTVLGIVGRDGAFAEYLTLPARNLLPVPDTVPDEVAVFTEPLAAALEIQEQIKVSPRDRVVVIGAGKLGQLVARTLARTGCDLLVVGRHQKKLDLLAERNIQTRKGPALEAGSYDIAVECTGNPEGFQLARSALRPRGTLVLKSTYADHLSLDASSLVVDEITLVGSRCGPFKPALELLASGAVDPRDEHRRRPDDPARPLHVRYECHDV
jgi:threonine dehydrogenase-like Zn-dependent dehydrogenase